MKRLRKGHTTVLVDAGGYPRDATGHRTDLPAKYSADGRRLWYTEELAFALGERVKASRTHHRMDRGECGTIMQVSEFTLRDYYVLPDRLMHLFRLTRSGEHLSRMPEHYLEPE